VDFPAEIVVADSESPGITSSNAAFAVGNQLYGFSAVRGKWDSVQVATPTPPELLYSDDSVMATAGQWIYAFSTKTGRWTSVDTSGK
jgi:hypothetical protein